MVLVPKTSVRVDDPGNFSGKPSKLGPSLQRSISPYSFSPTSTPHISSVCTSVNTLPVLSTRGSPRLPTKSSRLGYSLQRLFRFRQEFPNRWADPDPRAQQTPTEPRLRQLCGHLRNLRHRYGHGSLHTFNRGLEEEIKTSWTSKESPPFSLR